MHTAFVAGHATGTPSPGGFGLVLAVGDRATWEQDGQLERTTPHEAHLIAVREALRAVPAHTHVELVTSSDLVRRLLDDAQQARKPELAQRVGEIRDLLHTRGVRVRLLHTAPDTMALLTRAQDLAQAATRRAAASVNSPACPRCGARMTIRDVRTGPRRGTRIWGCTRFPDCRGVIPLFGSGT
ncbi:hypothetical protein [Deinococcus radiotolerans]|uniref:RNase H type-1 domain-containing protein n=1 Tax=Deinococcus radiotolerans TaxID=1309407 RepID=A0ABQ2FP25_9DEIO|nr:hypothetical protein [Deinococcus radiotolerans]GGL12982.1 hypothetical protein GCM10010844_34690 [Deinococcus radiotolerans]